MRPCVSERMFFVRSDTTRTSPIGISHVKLNQKPTTITRKENTTPSSTAKREVNLNNPRRGGLTFKLWLLILKANFALNRYNLSKASILDEANRKKVVRTP